MNEHSFLKRVAGRRWTRGVGGGVDQTSMVSSISHGGEGTSNRPGQVVQRPILTLTQG